ncbi:hypothetical protein M231_00348 [Tremella mesenterica]|uniref:Mitochondrial import receptor subunit TOM20 n=1 Tax=Tremella mesenterica TaxID=5217 RepID=A0A4Q1BW55_TREME|nr:uncharacterized protein TREMEDRAFT_74243 [Tremella mesenterica DSM 1558]EIW68330.1 hypothetical protein TREMEDRAFT_74243 [Tremella mesenterica DSM 1558]RXK42358.1 hypothetical protein M231_00348 [Tremella mesenterica]
MTSRASSQIALASTAVAVTGFLGYCVYFDYMRRHNPQFRARLRRQHRQVTENLQAEIAKRKAENLRQLRAVMAQIATEPRPLSAEQQEAYFQENVAEGERLSLLGPEHHIDAATHFYKAMRTYPNPMELLMLYQRVVPPPIFDLLVQLSTLSSGPTGPTLTAVPPRPEASVADVDDSSPDSGSGGEANSLNSPNGASSGMGSGGEWEKVSDGVPAV